MITSILENTGLKLDINIPYIYVDNQAAVKLAENPEFHKRTKHIEITYHFTRQAVNNGLVKLYWIPTKDQVADIFTKLLPAPIFYKLITQANII